MPQPANAASISFKDRSRRLALFGVLAWLAGGASILLGLLHLALPALTRRLPGTETMVTDSRSLAMGLLLYVMIGGVLIVAGTGSLRCARWVRPLMLIIGWSWLIAGVMALLMIVSLLEDLIVLATAEAGTLPPAAVTLLQAMVLGGAALVGIVVPLAFIVVYRDRAVARTCEALHPQRDWSDSCPLPVLGLSGGLLLATLLTLPMVLRPVVPVFGRLTTGWPGGLLILAAAAATIVLALGLYRLRHWSWWATTAFLVLVGVSATATFFQVQPVEFYRAMGYPEQQLQRIDRAGPALRWSMVGGSVVLTLLTVVYMARIRRHFGADDAGPSPDDSSSLQSRAAR